MRAKAIRHLIWLGNLLRHGDGTKKVVSPDHRELLMEIGSRDSPASASCSETSNDSSNMSSINFNLASSKLQVTEESSCEKFENRLKELALAKANGGTYCPDGDESVKNKLSGVLESSEFSVHKSQSFGQLSIQAAINNKACSGKVGELEAADENKADDSPIALESSSSSSSLPNLK